ncbi:MAG: GMP synthase (glutamine-hydrolyzing) [Myxococcota bacterium]
MIDPGTRVPELDCFNRLARAGAVPLTLHLPALFGLDSLIRAESGLLGVVILGSGASVHDPLPWQGALGDWLRPRLEAGLPALGLCYGHQLLAHLLGGEVTFRADGVKLKGLRTVRIAADRLWGEGGEGPLIVSHREVVTALPPECTLRGSTEICAIEAFSHDRLPIAGIQAHPEATPAFAANNTVPFDADPAVLAFGHGLVDRFIAGTGHGTVGG